MTMVHVQRGEGRLNAVQINPAHVLKVESPSHKEGSPVPPYNAVITLLDREQVCAIEPRDVVFALIGNAAMDTKSNPGYFHAVKGAGDDEWLIRRSDYETE
jgi:hypothetical protein